MLEMGHNKRALVVSSGSQGSKRSKVSTELVQVPRTSELKAPILKLTGHGNGGVNGLAFSLDGRYLASAGFDKTVLIWSVFGDCENVGVLKGHKHSVQQVAWSRDGERLVSCSVDMKIKFWDINTGACLRTMAHDRFVNSCDMSEVLSTAGTVASASDDKTVKTWDPRDGKASILELKHDYEVTCVKYIQNRDSGSVPPVLFSGGVDRIIRAWDLRKPGSTLYTLEHEGVVTGIDSADDGQSMVAVSSDGAFRHWDMRVFVPGGDNARLKSTFSPSFANKDLLLLRCAISDKLGWAACGSNDRVVPIWALSEPSTLAYNLPGHLGPVIDVKFHPSEPIIASCSLDKTIFIGELEKTGA